MTLRERMQAFWGTLPVVDVPTRSALDAVAAAFKAGIESTPTGSLARYRQAAYANHSWTYACLRVVAQSLAAVPIRLWKRDAGKRPQTIDSHPLLDLLNDPFPELYGSGEMFRYQLALYWLAGGNAWLMRDEAVRRKTGVPISLAVFGRKQVQPIREESTGKLRGWELRIGRTTQRLPVEALDHIKFPVDPESGDLILGIGPLQAAQAAVDADFAAQTWNAAFFKNGAQPNTVLTYEPPTGERTFLTTEQREQLRQGFLEDHQGAEKAHGFHIVSGPFRLERLGMSQKDMDFLDARKYAREEISAVFGVPVVLVNGFENAGLGREGVQVAQRLLYENTILPMLRILQAALQRAYVDQYAPEAVLEFATDEIPAFREDETKKAEIAERYWRMGATWNELIDALNLPFKHQPWGDTWWVGAMQVPADVQMSNGGDQLLPPVAQKPPQSLPAPNGDVATEESEQLDEPEERRVRAVEDFELVPGFPGRDPIREARWRAWVASWRPLERRYMGRIRRYFFDRRKAALEALNDFRSVRTTVDDILTAIFDREEADRELMALSQPFFESAITLGAVDAAAVLGVTEIGLESPAARALLALKTKKVVGINDSMWWSLRETLFEGFELGENMTLVAGRIRKEFNAASAARSRTIARTEISGTVNGGKFVEMQEQGVSRLGWVSAGDENVRKPPESKFNHAIDGEVVDIGNTFSNGLKFPLDPEWQGAAGNIINCRCTVEPFYK